MAASMIFLVGSILYCVALLRDGKAPRIPIIAYAIATVPIGLRNFVPEPVLDLALGLLGASVITPESDRTRFGAVGDQSTRCRLFAPLKSSRRRPK